MTASDFDVTHQNQNIESRIVAALERISQAYRVLLWQESITHSLSPLQVQVLIFLLHHSAEKRRVSSLADEFNVSRPTLSDTVRSLEQKGYISREADPADSRSQILHLTAEGKAMAAQTSLFTREVRTPIEQLSPAARADLLQNLLGIIQHLNQAGIITVQRMCFTCAHYQAHGKAQRHFCKLLNQTLKVQDLRLDCPEHLVRQPG